MLIDAGLANQFWGESVMTAIYLQNCLPPRKIEKTPYEVWFGKNPDLKHIRTFVSKEFKHVLDEHQHKLDKKVIELTFVVHADGSKAYRLLAVNTKHVFISRDVKFKESCHDNLTL